MTQEIEIVLLPEEKDDELLLKQKAAQALKIALNRIQSVQIRKRSIDAQPSGGISAKSFGGY